VPRVIAAAGDKAARRFLEFFAATIRNKNTRMAYYRACVRFFAWCDHHKIGEIADIEPLHVAAYVEALGKDFEKPTVKQHLAAIRMLFDWLVTGQVVATNPAHSVRGPKHVVKTGKTTVLTGEQAREHPRNGRLLVERSRRAFQPVEEFGNGRKTLIRQAVIDLLHAVRP
jgi:integrase/recombinase XerC